MAVHPGHMAVHPAVHPGHMAVHPGIILAWPGYLGIPGYLDKGGHMAVHPGIISGLPDYLGIPGYLVKWVVYGCLSWDNPGMARLLGNPRILVQGGAYGCPSWDNLGMAKLLGNPRILGQGGVAYGCPSWAYGCPSCYNPGMARLLGNPRILVQGGAYGCLSWDNPGMARLLGNPGILGQGGWPYGPETVDTPRNPVHGDNDTAASSSSDRTPLSHSSRMSISISSSSKHKQGKYDPEWERMYPWVYQSEDGKGMFCRLCKRFNTHNERNYFAVFNMTTCVSLRKDVLARHADSSMHKSAMMQEHDRLASQQGGGIEQAFSKAISIEKTAALGAMKCLYWLAKNEIAHTTSYVPLLELVRSLGCSYFDSLQVGGNATYTSERMIQEFIQNMSSQIETGLLQELRNSPCVALMFLF